MSSGWRRGSLWTKPFGVKAERAYESGAVKVRIGAFRLLTQTENMVRIELRGVSSLSQVSEGARTARFLAPRTARQEPSSWSFEVGLSETGGRAKMMLRWFFYREVRSGKTEERGGNPLGG